MKIHDTKNATSFKKDFDYEKYVNLSVQWNRWILKPIGLWPNSLSISKAEKWIYRMINFICYCLMCFLFLPCGLYVILEVNDFSNKLKLTAPLNFCWMAFLKYYSMVIHGEDIRECIKHIEVDWKNVSHITDRDIMVANAAFGRRLVTICTFFMYSGFAFYFIGIPISVGSITAEDTNLTFIPFAFPFSKYIMDARHSPVNEIFVFIQFIAGLLINDVTVSACSLAALFATHACGQLEVLCCWLNHLVDGRADMSQNIDDRIAKIVAQHVRVLNFLKIVEKTMRQISFIEFFGSTLSLCLVGYCIIVEWDLNNLTVAITYIVLLVSLTFNIFIFCYIGELVAEQCHKIGEVSYMVDWYRIAGKKKLCFLLVIAMSSSSIKLTAGNIIILSLSSFSNVVKTSVAYLNMLRTLA